MNQSVVSAYRALNEAQNAIERADSLDEALQEGLKVILTQCGAEAGAIWYADAERGNVLRPFFWVGHSDLTSDLATYL